MDWNTIDKRWKKVAKIRDKELPGHGTLLSPSSILDICVELYGEDGEITLNTVKKQCDIHAPVG